MPEWKIEKAKTMRRWPTAGERRIWPLVRTHGTGADRVNPLGVKVRRQAPILGYIADFYIPAVKLVIEIDGGSHIGRENTDRTRDARLLARGIRTLRISETEATMRPALALERIRQAMEGQVAART